MPAKISLHERALRLLSRREHSRGELFRKLSPHAENPKTLGELLDDLAGRGLLSDARYARMRVGAREARYGNFFLVNELRARGVDDDLINEALASCGDESLRACRVLRRKFGDSPAESLEESARRARFLARRGFSSETVDKAVRCDFVGE
jgi:regulatory protein